MKPMSQGGGEEGAANFYFFGNSPRPNISILTRSVLKLMF